MAIFKKKVPSQTYFKIFLVSILAIGLSAGIKLSMSDQNIAEKAKISGGLVEIFTEFHPAQGMIPATLDFYINTQGQVIEGVQLGLTISTPANTFKNVEGVILQNSGLSQVQPPLFIQLPDGTGAKVLLAALAQQALSNQTFSTITPIKFATLTIDSSDDIFSAGVEFDPVLSKVTHVDQYGEVQNLLSPISRFKIN